MTEKEILDLVEEDEWMMDILRRAESLRLKDWAVAGGLIRGKVWNALHGVSTERVDTADIDVAYFDSRGNDQNLDE